MAAAAERAEKEKSSIKRLGEGDLQFDKDKLAHALKEERKRKAVDAEEGFGDKRRKYNNAMDVDVTEEDLGTFYMLKLSESDGG